MGLEPAGGLEPPTPCLQDRCAASCATPAGNRAPAYLRPDGGTGRRQAENLTDVDEVRVLHQVGVGRVQRLPTTLYTQLGGELAERVAGLTVTVLPETAGVVFAGLAAGLGAVFG